VQLRKSKEGATEKKIEGPKLASFKQRGRAAAALRKHKKK